MPKSKIQTITTDKYIKVFVEGDGDTLHRIATIPKTAEKHVDIKSMVKAIQNGTKSADGQKEDQE